MKKLRKRSIILILILSICITFFSPTCIGVAKAAGTEDKTTGYVLNKTLLINETYKLQTEIIPEGASQGVTYESSDSSIIAVDADGLVTALKEGKADIIVTSKDNQNITAKCSFEVKDIPVALELNTTYYSMVATENYQLTANLVYISGKKESVAANRLTYTSSNAGIVNVANGKITALEQTSYPQSTAIKTAYEFTYNYDGETISKTLESICNITVTKIPVTNISLKNDVAEKTLKLKETYTLFPVISPANATEQGVTFKSSKSSVASVSSSGKITAKDIGEADITVASKDNPEIKTIFHVKVYQTEFVVTDFGAKGNDKSSDGKVIDKVLSYAKKVDAPITVKVPAGTYYIDRTLDVYSDTNIILDKKAVIKRKSDKSDKTMLRSSVNSKKGGYAQCSNVTVKGGVWDGNANGSHDSNLIYFGHAENITIKDTVIKNASGAHLIELAGVKNALIENVELYGYKKCKEKGYKANQAEKEAIQIDYCSSVTAPAMKPYDGTHCKDIVVKNSYIHDYMAGIGSHMASSGKYAENVTIVNNKFKNITDACIKVKNYKNLKVSGNKASAFSTFLYASASKGTISSNSIKNKSFKRMTNSGIISGNGITVSRKSNFSITKNTIENCKSNGICVWDSSTATVKSNKIKNNKLYGLRMKASSVSLSKNSLSKNKEGTYHTYSDAKIKSSDDIRAYYVPIKKSYKYTGKSIKPKIKIKGLKQNKHFKVSYKNNKKKGTATIYIKGKGKIKGTKKITFKIVKKK